MRRFVLTGLTTFALLGGGSMLAALPAHATPTTTLVVDADGKASDGNCGDTTTVAFTTIQGALNAANDGDTIDVCPGTYTENLTSSLANITLLGAQAGVAAPGRMATESIIDGSGAQAIDLAGGSPTVDGFTVTDTYNTDDLAAIQLDAGGASVRNTVFTDDRGAAELGGGSTFSGNDVELSTTEPTFGVFFGPGVVDMSVTDNYFSGDLTGGALSYVDKAPPTDSQLTITDNIADISAGGNFAQLIGTRKADIERNDVEGSGTSGSGIVFQGDNSGYVVQGNRFDELGSSAGVSIENDGNFAVNGGGTIDGNAFLSGSRGIQVQYLDSGAMLEAESNIFLNNFGGISNTTAATIDATNNYWGCDAGPGVIGCDTTDNTSTGSIDTTPWLDLNTSVAHSSIVKGGTTSFTADLNHNSIGTVIGEPVMDGILAATFHFTNGSVSPSNVNLVSGVAATTITGTTVGLGTATASLDDSSSGKSVQVTSPVTKPPALTIHDNGLAEGNSGTHPMTFTVTLNKAATKVVTVHFATSDSSAIAGSDYVAKSGVLTIAKGKKQATFTVLIKGDKVKEPSELFLVKLSNPTNATIADGTATGTIRNDD